MRTWELMIIVNHIHNLIINAKTPQKCFPYLNRPGAQAIQNEEQRGVLRFVSCYEQVKIPVGFSIIKALIVIKLIKTVYCLG